MGQGRSALNRFHFRMAAPAWDRPMRPLKRIPETVVHRGSDAGLPKGGAIVTGPALVHPSCALRDGEASLVRILVAFDAASLAERQGDPRRAGLAHAAASGRGPA